MKKIVILNGSNSNRRNTAGLIEAFTRGASEAGHEVVKLDVAHMNIHGCLGCMKCMTLPKDADHICVQKDDMASIYPAVMEADVLVFASPMYWWGITGQLKTAVDRLQAVVGHAGLDHLAGKSTALLVSYRGGGARAVLAWYGVFRQIVGCRDLGSVIGFEDQGREEAYRLGSQIR